MSKSLVFAALLAALPVVSSAAAQTPKPVTKENEVSATATIKGNIFDTSTGKSGVATATSCSSTVVQDHPGGILTWMADRFSGSRSPTTGFATVYTV